MKAVDYYLKVEVDLPDSEDVRRYAEELCRQLSKNYAVRKAELSSVTEHES
jgi:hypothetical protein